VLLAALAGGCEDTIPPSSEKEITAFIFASPAAAGTISGTDIAVTVPFGTDVTSLTPTITHTGASINPASGAAWNFSAPVEYIVTAEDGSTASYTVTVTVGSASAKAITAFSFASPAATGSISGTDVAVTVPYGTNVTSLVPAITVSPGATVNPASGVAQDFSDPVEYVVTAADKSTVTWTVTVTVASSTAKEITGFSFASPAAEGTVNAAAKTVSVTVPYNTERNGLIPTITISGASIAPASLVAQYFSVPVEYVVTAADGTTAPWTVTVTVQGPLNSIAEVTAWLGSASGGASAADPVPLPVSLNLASDWGNLLSAITDANSGSGAYVALDLSACTMTGTEFDSAPGAAAAGEQYVVSLVLPNAARSIKDGSYSNALFQYFTALKDVSGANVETIGNSAFINCAALTAASFPEATSIGNSAFFNCNVTTASFPKATDIGEYAFTQCGALTTASFPLAASIGNAAFANCTDLTTASFPLAASIGNSAFQGCTALTTASFPAATSIGNYAFFRCTALTTVSLPASLTSIDGNPFIGCTGLANITVDGDNSTYKHSDDHTMLLNKAGTTLFSYPTAEGAVTLNGITSIGVAAFSGCTDLTSVFFPDATSISYDATSPGHGAFDNCTALTTASFPKAASIGGHVFRNTGTTALTITLGTTAPTVSTSTDVSGTYSKTVTIKAPSGRTGYDGTWPDNFKKAFGTGTTVTLNIEDTP
jgi:hypothetical protein